MEDVKMDYLNDADSMYVDSEVTWFWQFRRGTAGLQNVGQRGDSVRVGGVSEFWQWSWSTPVCKNRQSNEKKEQGE